MCGPWTGGGLERLTYLVFGGGGHDVSGEEVVVVAVGPVSVSL